jgi:ATP-dependent Clp protease ATP-binding subunit ClpC
MWQRFSEELRRVIFYAQETAARLGSNDVGTEHLLRGLMRQNADEPDPVLAALVLSPDVLSHELEPFLIDVGDPPGNEMRLTPGAKKALDLSYAEAEGEGNSVVGLRHLMVGLTQEGEPSGVVFARLGIDAERVRRAVSHLGGEGQGGSG